MGKTSGWVTKQVVWALLLVAVAFGAPSAALACGGPPLVLPSGDFFLMMALFWIGGPLLIALAGVLALNWLLS
jgi:hypothetical protein